MKNKIVFSILGLTMAISVSGQLTQEKVYDFSLTTTKINLTEYKYYLMDVPKSECRIYNMDHTLWKTIPVSLPSGYYLYDIKFVSQNLFNSDVQTELWYSAYNWVSTGTSSGYYRYISKVISENGTALADIAGGAYAYIVQAGTDLYKLAVYAYDNSVSPYTVKTQIYSLPNPSSAINFVSILPEDPYPNPAKDIVNLPLAGITRKGVIQVFSLSGQKMTEAEISGKPLFQLNTTGWTPGIYSYRVVSEGKISPMKSFIIR